MNASFSSSTEPASPGFTIDDIYFVLFRHKWTILFLSLLGLLVAAAVYKRWPETVYRSEAKLFIRYLQETKVPGGVGDDARIMSTDQRGETIIIGELEILKSMDLAKQVAAKIGPATVLRAAGGGDNLDGAASLIHGGLTAGAPRGSRVVTLAFEHPDRAVAQAVLGQVITEYLKKHVEIHRAPGLYDDFLSKETLLLRSRLAQTEEQLGKLKEKAGVISIEESKRASAEQMSSIRQQIFQNEIELEKRKAYNEEFGGVQTREGDVPVEKARDYRNTVALLETLNRHEQELLYSYHPETSQVVAVRKRITENEGIKASLEKAYPSLVIQAALTGGPESRSPTERAAGNRERIRELETENTVLLQHLQRIRNEASELATVELSLVDLQRRKELQEQHYRYFSAGLEQSRIDEALSSGRVSNINTIQAPTPPVSDVGKLYKVVGGISGSGLVAGLLFAFGTELFLDRTVKRPQDIRGGLRLPLMLSIPRLDLRALGRGEYARRAALPAAPGSTAREGTTATAVKPSEALWVADHPLQPYCEALANQLIHHFEVRNFMQKPKLVAVTSCGPSAGVSTVAAGIAASLSKTGEGNVLLVAAGENFGNSQHFQKGVMKPDLAEALACLRSGETQVTDHLYVASTSGGPDAELHPRRFANLVPTLKASNFEYIIFDMPPVNQLSATAQLARHMDAVLLVVEAEKTAREMVNQAALMLTASCAQLGIVLNKTRSYFLRTTQMAF